MATRSVRKCGFCKLSGHTISSCQDPSIIQLKADAQNAGDFCVAYGSLRYLKAWLNQCTIPKLRILLGSTPEISEANTLKEQYCIELIKLYYTDRLTEPGIKERLKEQLPQEIVSNIRETIIEWTNLRIIRMTVRERRHASNIRDEIRIYDIDTAMANIRDQYNRLYQEREDLIYAISERQLEIDNYDKTRSPKKFNIVAKLKEDKDESCIDCPICFDSIPKKDMITTNCNHDYCGACLTNYFNGLSCTKDPSCPLCREQITQLQFKNKTLFNDIREKYILEVQAQEPPPVHEEVQEEVQEEVEEVTWTIERTIQTLFH
jgi:hypothetical protein